ncbi:thymidine phosphorylase family protein [Legionella tucsonensis]|uniref:Putative thymidine phosphorylase n=1 Tax=Legionella tucsonensis TaxID=40335 RepID=A0A0W0ZUG9_9GAMM|nr:thymidine phosphorylase family protein [Legionella tucsonensis]KTD72796.1 thymidine phosphorylase [Legionella tucsonensis]
MNAFNNEAVYNSLSLKWLGIDTYKESVIYMQRDCLVCQTEGFEMHTRIRVTLGDKSILATLNHIDNDILGHHQASLSIYAWKLLNASEGDVIKLSHPKPLQSLSFVRSKIYGHKLNSTEVMQIIEDIAQGRYSDIQVATFLTACAGGRLDETEIIHLTQSMIQVGANLSWPQEIVVDKHCVGGLPGNRTTPIVVAIVAAFGMMIPKTSSRAITSPAGTADTMETLAPVDLDIKAMQRVVEQENGCIVWGGSVGLSPADDILIRVERSMDVDSEGQLIASVLSKKISSGSTHIVIDIPVGPTAKIRSIDTFESLQHLFHAVGSAMGVQLRIIKTDGLQPVGQGIGPALEAKDVLAVLLNQSNAPQDLRKRALMLAGVILEFSPSVATGQGMKLATQLLVSGKAWRKFLAICNAQGGLREPTTAAYTQAITAEHRGKVINIDNRNLSRLAKLAGAPHDKAAGVVLHTPINTVVEKGQPLYTIHSESRGALRYALSLLNQISTVVQVETSK